jgi:hypothetical protein
MTGLSLGPMMYLNSGLKSYGNSYGEGELPWSDRANKQKTGSQRVWTCDGCKYSMFSFHGNSPHSFLFFFIII